LVAVLGFDIGGANTKAAFLTVENGEVQSCKVAVEYFPVWKDPNKLTNVLTTLKGKLCTDNPDVLGVTMTAELSDAYQTKREGVHHILGCVKKAFPNLLTFVLNTDVELQSIEASLDSHLSVAAANWAATGWLVAQKVKQAVVVDIGSTSTSIIPIVNGKVVAFGKTDLEKLIYGELVYTGSLRTNVATIVHSIPIKGDVATVSSELFALSGDVHTVLGHISQQDYSSETADGRGKTIFEAMARLTRVVCADTEMLSHNEIVDMAKYIYGNQIQQVAVGLSKVYNRTKSLATGLIPVVVTGLGRDFLARKVAEQIGVDHIIDLGDLLQTEAVMTTPAFGVALMAAIKIEENMK
jgi:(4-(4-[2-(gamma-L-glutamylamino)ethyl]phenoxymethyl)furan-2-yl)methanamine synthase